MEREPAEKPNPEVVQLNQDFQLFQPDRTEQSLHRTSSMNMYHTQVTLHSDDAFPLVSLTLDAHHFRTSRAHTITPFDPEIGYQITKEDGNRETRTLKIRAIKNSGYDRMLIDAQKAPLMLDVRSDESYLISAGIAEKQEFFSRIKTEYSATLKRLRFQAFFPNSSFEAMPFEALLELGTLWFNKYYPLETGPLPTTEFGYNFDHGFHIHLPSDRKQLEQIRGKFILLPEP